MNKPAEGRFTDVKERYKGGAKVQADRLLAARLRA
jgi:hypothetical protein